MSTTLRKRTNLIPLFTGSQAIRSTVKIHGTIIAETTEADLQSALTNVIQPIQTAVAFETGSDYAPSNWYSEESGIVCQVGEYCIKLEMK